MSPDDKITEIFFICDEFSTVFEQHIASMGRFYGFKLHLICNEKGEIVNFMFTSGNVDDREPLRCCFARDPSLRPSTMSQEHGAD